MDLDRLLDRAASWPSPPNRSSALTIEIARSHIGAILDRWPMAPETLRRHLTALHEELSAYSPHLHAEVVTRDFLALPPEQRKRAHRALAAASDEVVAAVEQIAAIRLGVEPSDTTPVLPEPELEQPPPLLTDVVIEMLTRIAWGDEIVLIAKDTFTSIHTIKSRLEVAGKTLGCDSGGKVDVVMTAIRRGLVEPPVFVAIERPSDVQLEVLQHISEGRTVAEAAERLGVPRGTVKSRLQLIANRLGTDVNQAHLCAIAYAHGWIT